jgi:PAS domain S-box-containing protein
MVRAYDWAETPIGPVETWQPGLCAVTTMMLSSSVPMAVLWGRDGILLYNDAYIAIAGNRHPELFGRPIQQAWPEVAEFNAYVLTTVLTGKSLSYRDMEMALARNRDADRLWVNLDFSPLLDDNGVPAGVLAIVTDTTDRVLAEREIAAQRDRLRIMFDQAPGFIAMMEGPEHVFTLVNQAYNRLMGSRNAVGRTVRDAVPEAIAHGLLRELDAAYVSGKPFVANDFKFAIADARGRIEDHYLDFVYQPIRDADGQICGIFAQGSDVTERVLATEALHRSRQEYRKLNDALIMANDILSSVPQAKPGSGD